MKREGMLNLQGEKLATQFIGGFFNIDKPAGWTSHDVVAKIRGLLRMKRVGHLGTLDPQATGVLPICFGKGTKLASYLSADDKEYEAVLRLGQETDTEDASGHVTQTSAIPAHLEAGTGEKMIIEALMSFVGPYLQQPPMYSAIKQNGVPLYKTARRGEVVHRASRLVTIKELSFLGYQNHDIAFRVSCSKGTYIRTLCLDIGKKLGVGGHLLSLRRIKSGNFALEDAVDLESFSTHCKAGTWPAMVYALNSAMSKFPALWVKAGKVKPVLNGVQVGFSDLERWDVFKKEHSLRFLDDKGELIALGNALCDSENVTPGSAPFKIKTVLGQLGN